MRLVIVSVALLIDEVDYFPDQAGLLIDEVDYFPDQAGLLISDVDYVSMTRWNFG